MANLEPAAKLPLAVRKNVRDEWEAKQPEFEKQLSDILGTPWKFDINPLAIFPYAEDDSYAHRALGSCISDYVEGAVSEIKRYAGSHGKAGIGELNSVCSTHTIDLFAATGFSYCGGTVTNGKLNIVFNPKALGANVSDALYDISEVVSKAPQPTGAPKLSFAARHAIKKDYEPEIGEVLESSRRELQNPKLEFDPNFEQLGSLLKGAKNGRDDWERNFGSFALMYFQSFRETLVRQKFGEDEMLREGFEEAVPKGIVRLRLVEEMSGYNELLIEDGVCIMQTTAENFGTNISDTAEGLVDKL